MRAIAWLRRNRAEVAGGLLAALAMTAIASDAEIGGQGGAVDQFLTCAGRATSSLLDDVAAIGVAQSEHRVLFGEQDPEPFSAQDVEPLAELVDHRR